MERFWGMGCSYRPGRDSLGYIPETLTSIILKITYVHTFSDNILKAFEGSLEGARSSMMVEVVDAYIDSELFKDVLDDIAHIIT